MLRQKLRDARDEGFTLTELLIVIVVLGILASIVVVGVSTFRADAVKAACNSEVKTVALASDAYFAKTGGYALSIVGTNPSLVSTGYLKTAPVTVVANYTITYAPATGVASATHGNPAVAGCP